MSAFENIDSVVTLVRSRLEGAAWTSPINLCREYDPCLPQVDCYIGLINQVIMNLVENAIDAIRERQAQSATDQDQTDQHRGLIQIQTQQFGGTSVRVMVRDNGTGIDEATRAKIFDPFFTTKPVGVGTGMGLATSYQIVAGNHGGNLSCASVPGEGTTFTLELPVQKLGAPGASTPQSPRAT
ncbi:MAG: ATP-binding protein [Cyanobacteria bacterium P01_H01_bin.130]